MLEIFQNRKLKNKKIKKGHDYTTLDLGMGLLQIILIRIQNTLQNNIISTQAFQEK